MRGQTLLTVVVAFTCIASVGVAATTMQSSLSSTPDEVVDLGYDLIPLSPSDTSELKRALTSPGQGSESAEQSDSAEPPTEEQSRLAGTGSNERERAGEGHARQQREQPADSNERSSSAADQSGSQRDQSGVSFEGPGDFPVPYKNWFVLLLVALVLAALVRYRDRVAAFFGVGPVDASSEPSPPRPAPANDVERAWVALLGAAGIDDPWARTPGECAATAIERGLDPDEVERVRRTFEEVRFGEREVTEARRRRVRRSLSRLGLGGTDT